MLSGILRSIGSVFKSKKAPLSPSAAPFLDSGSEVASGDSELGDANSVSEKTDAHMPPALGHAVFLAMNVESNPTSLRSFGDCLLPDFPSAGSALFARALLCIAAQEHMVKERMNGKQEQDDEAVVLFGAEMESFDDPVSQAKSFAEHLAKRGAKITFTGPNGEETAIPLSLTVNRKLPRRGELAALPLDTKTEAQRLLASKSFQEIMKKGEKTLPLTFASVLVQTAGQTFPDAPSFERTISLSEKRTSALLGTYAKRSELESLLAGAGHLACGKTVPKDILGLLRAVLPPKEPPAENAKSTSEVGSDLAKKWVTELNVTPIPSSDSELSLRTGLVLELAKILQDADFVLASPLLPSQSGNLSEKVLAAIRLGAGPDLVLQAVTKLQGELPAGSANEARRVAASVASAPEILRLPSRSMAEKLQTKEPIVRAVVASCSFDVPGAPLVEPEKLYMLVGVPDEPPPADRGHVKLALLAARGNPSAQKQLSFARTQNPSDAPSIDIAERMARRAICQKHYMDIEKAAGESG